MEIPGIASVSELVVSDALTVQQHGLEERQRSAVGVRSSHWDASPGWATHTHANCELLTRCFDCHQHHFNLSVIGGIGDLSVCGLAQERKN